MRRWTTIARSAAFGLLPGACRRYPSVNGFRCAATAAPSGDAANSSVSSAPPSTSDDASVDYTMYTPAATYEMEVKPRMQAKHGSGTWDMYRSLYKELCDEMRRESTAKPPAPLEDWEIEHTAGSAFVGFIRRPKAGAKPNTSSTYAWSRVQLADPAQVNETLTFLNWYPVEACVVRKGCVLHFSVAYAEGSMHLRNVRAYRDETGALAGNGRDINYIRQHLRYDGPFMGHLELDVQTELTDIMLDAGVDPDFLRFAGAWIAYLEHVEYVRWMLGVLKTLIKDGEDESLTLTREEREELDTLAEEWLPAHHV